MNFKDVFRDPRHIRRGALVGIVGLLSVGVAPWASASTPTSISASSSVGLTPNQTITITGTGFTPGGTVGVAECATGAVTADTCDIYAARIITAAADGSITTDFTVKRFISVAGNPLDCSAVDACIIAAANVTNYPSLPPVVTDGTGLAFSMTVPPPPDQPIIAVTPSTGLADGQQVAVQGAGFTPSGTVGLTQCPTGSLAYETCDTEGFSIATSDPAGEWNTSFTAKRTFTSAGTKIDCAVAPGCVLAAATIADFSIPPTSVTDSTSAPLAFDPAIPALLPVTISARALPLATVSRSTGTMRTRVEVRCNQKLDVYVSVFATQGRKVSGYGNGTAPCDRRGTAVVEVSGFDGSFRAGIVKLEISSYAFNARYFGQAQSTTTAIVIPTR